ncbi:Cd(II)/Pb(II)-responsive transcriptional regulator [Marinobacter lacisalsi]|uniref:Cd(II)/Pb(II)-responsive transcriptional regulator n=1 Tax=Marinobacter lacisalsi TaxID=475979 RepID=A0ABV8QIN0_9GAMM
MKIGEVAQQAGIPVETVRYYEKIGLLPQPDRQANGYRRYRQSHLDRLLFIRRCRNLDMAQDEIRELVRLADQPDADCSEVDALLARHLEHVRERLEELQQLESTLSRLQQACSEGRTVAECGILGGLSDELTGNLPHDSHNHIPGSHGTR